MMTYDTFENDDSMIRVDTDWDLTKDKLLDRIDFRTGEILEEVEYETVEYKAEEHISEEDVKEYRRTTIAPELFTSKYQLDTYMEGVDKRKIVTFSRVKQAYGHDSFEHDINKKKKAYTAPMTKVLIKLIDGLVYRNIIIDTKKGLAETLGVNEKNVMRTLKTAGWAIRVYTEKEGMKRGHIKVLIHPDLAFKHYSPKHTSCNVNTARSVCLNAWVKPTVSDLAKHTDWLIDPDNHVDNNYGEYIEDDLQENPDQYRQWVLRSRKEGIEDRNAMKEFLEAA